MFLASQEKYWRSVCERWECLFRWDDAGEKVCMSLSDSYCLHALSYIFQKVQLKFSSCSCALYNNHNLWSTTSQHRHNPRVKFLTSQCSLQFFITAEISQAFVLVQFFLSTLSGKNSSRSSQAGFGGREQDVYCSRRMAEQLWLYLETGIPTLGKFTIAKCELFSLVKGNKKRHKKACCPVTLILWPDVT